MTLDDIFVLYFEKHAKLRTRRPDNAAFFWKRYCADTWSTEDPATITRIQVQDWLDGIATDHGQSAANRACDVLAAVVRWGNKRGYFTRADDPLRGVEKFRQKSRERFLLPEEIQRFRSALDSEPPLLRDFFYLCLFTGARRGNVQSMLWADVSLTLQTWTFNNKNGDRHTVPLTVAALAVLERRKQDAGGIWVFPSRRSKSGHLVEPKRAWKRVLERAQIEGLTIHDIRRTVGSYLAIAGESEYMIAKVLGHKDARSTKVYARLNLEPVRRSLESIQSVLLGS